MKTDPNDFDYFKLDPNRLDEEWLNQPKLYHEQALRLADARAEYERSKAQRDVVAAEIDRDIRASPDVFGVIKITEGVVQNTILLQKRFRIANDEVIKAKHLVDVLGAVVDALDHRKKALENLVQLESRDYFASPRAPTGASNKLQGEKKADKAFGKRRGAND